MPQSIDHATVLAFHTHPVRAGRLQLGKLRWANRSADPWPEHLTHRAQAQILPPLQKIDDRAVVAVIPHREENMMAIAVAFDDDLVVAASQHRASPPTLAPIHLIAETNGELAHINLSFESVEFGILAHQSTPLFPYC